MDAIDLKLLALLQENAKMSVKELAKAVFLSAPATAERIKKLEEQEIIEGYGTRLNLKKIGRDIQAIVLFETMDCKALAAFCEAHPDVLTCYRVAGAISYIAHVATPSVETLEQFIDASMAYAKPSTNIVLSCSSKKSILPLGEL